VLIAGMPKSGTTALAAAVNAAAGGRCVFEPMAYEQAAAVPDCSVIKIVYAEHDRRSLREVMHEFSACEKRVWIARDPRDQLVSIFLYTWFRAHRMPEDRFQQALDFARRKESGERIPFHEVLERTFGASTYYHDPSYYLDRVMPFFESTDANSVVKFSYDDLIAGRFAALSDYLGIPVAGAEVHPDHQRVVRSKSSGSWRTWFEPEDVAKFRPFLASYMDKIGIADDWETTSEPPKPALASWYMLWLRAGATGPRPASAEEAEAALIAADQAAEEAAMQVKQDAAAQTEEESSLTQAHAPPSAEP
jgi:hypothetical protein